MCSLTEENTNQWKWGDAYMNKLVIVKIQHLKFDLNAQVHLLVNKY